jgi:Bacterial TSP3 repeat
MNRSVTALTAAILSLCASGQAATTIDPVNHFSYGANVGWMDWRADAASGAVIGEFVCSGYIYAANLGWIHLGSGSPANGMRYRNNSASDFGVNHDGAGNLNGFAYGANIGWITFTNRDASGAVFQGPKVNLLNGRLSGFVWGANVGWISLSNAFAFVQTDSIAPGVDTDGDGLPDAWELNLVGNLTTLNGGGDNDGDGHTNLEEYLADTNPLDPSSNLSIALYSATAMGASQTISWPSQPSRLYRLQKRTDLNASPWVDSGLGLILPDAGAITTRMYTDSASPQRFYRIEAVKPLAP